MKAAVLMGEMSRIWKTLSENRVNQPTLRLLITNLLRTITAPRLLDG